MERRKFLRNGGLLGAILGATGGAVAMAQQQQPAALPTVVPKEDISHLAPPGGATTLQIMGSYLTEEEAQAERMRIGSNGSLGIGTSGGPYYFSSSARQTHSVSMTVGKDNRLWIKVGDQWQRVALES
jgi:hypothetical protein